MPVGALDVVRLPHVQALRLHIMWRRCHMVYLSFVSLSRVFGYRSGS